MTSKSSISFEGYLYTALWNAAYIPVLWPTSVLSRKLKSHHYCLEHLDETSYKVWKCMDRQCNELVKHIMRCLRYLPLSQLCPLPKSSLISHLINDSLLDIWSDVASTHQYLAQNFNKPAPVTLPRFYHLRTKVWNVKKSQVERCNWRTASRDKAARCCVYGALAHCTFKT